MDFVKNAWNGKEKLWKVFWLAGVLGGLALNILGKILTALLGPFGLIIALISVPYIIWYFVAIWRCAFNADWRGWGYIARIYLLLPLIAIPLVIGGIYLAAVSVTAHQRCNHDLAEQAKAANIDPQQYRASHQADLDACLHSK